MKTVLTRLRDTGLKVNAAKSLFCAHDIKYLSFILTRDGIKPQPKKVQSIFALNLPNNVKELRHLLGMVQQYYRDMWARHSEMLAPLTDLVGECGETKITIMNKTKKKLWRWDPIHQQAFNNIEAAIAKETVLAYLDLSKPFEIYTNASATQLGPMIAQDNRPIAFFSRKLSKTQQKYSAVSLLFNLGAARRGRSVLFSDEQKLLFKGWKKGFVMNTKLDFMRRQLNLE
jgi:hypothetical protein